MYFDRTCKFYAFHTFRFFLEDQYTREWLKNTVESFILFYKWNVVDLAFKKKFKYSDAYMYVHVCVFYEKWYIRLIKKSN